MKNVIRAVCALLVAVLTLASLPGALAARKPKEIVKELFMDYGFHQHEADESIGILLDELDAADSFQGQFWRGIMDYWFYVNDEMALSYDGLPEGLDRTDALCLIVLGFHLMPDGSIRPELENRLETALLCSQQYPNACVLCTGGGTATKNSKAREARQMAKWLVEHGVDEARIIVEDGSKTTGENAIKSCKILREKYPNVKYAAIVSSDYHIPWGSILFETEFRMDAVKNNKDAVSIVANACCRIEDPEQYPFSYQAGGLMELIGEKSTANKIYEKKAKAPKLRS